MRPLVIIDDPVNDLITICGVKYSGHFFRSLAIAQPGSWLRIESRKEVLTVFQPDEATERMFDTIIGKSVGSYPDEKRKSTGN